MKAEGFLDEGVSGWLAVEARRNSWRFAGWFTTDDLIQEGYVVFTRCARAYFKRYPEVAEQEAPTKAQRSRFQALLKVSFRNHLNSLVVKQDRLEEPLSAIRDANSPDAEASLWDRLLPPTLEAGTLAVKIAQAPSELKALLKLLAGDSMAGVEYLRTKARTKRDTSGRTRKVLVRRAVRETTNEHLCRLLGLDPEKVDLAKLARDHFSS